MSEPRPRGSHVSVAKNGSPILVTAGGSPIGMISDDDSVSAIEDRENLFSALDSFHAYSRFAYEILDTKRLNLYSLPTSHSTQLTQAPISMPSSLEAVKVAINRNNILFSQILDHGLLSYGLPGIFTDLQDGQAPEIFPPEWRDTASPAMIRLAEMIFRRLYREWSVEGRPERYASYRPIFASIRHYFSELKNRAELRILVPGAGLGRLMYELCAEGYTVEGNEMSYHCLMTSSFMFNCCTRSEEHEIFPWALDFSNLVKRDDQLQSIRVPDTLPTEGLRKLVLHGCCIGSMSMTAADFCILYAQEEYQSNFNVVATVFFIDTAPDFLRYLATVKNCLKSGGIWTNVGPLKWHFQDVDKSEDSCPMSNGSRGVCEPGSVELSNDEIMRLLVVNGFRVERHVLGESTGYVQNPNSMQQITYRPSIWVAVKL